MSLSTRYPHGYSLSRHVDPGRGRPVVSDGRANEPRGLMSAPTSGALVFWTQKEEDEHREPDDAGERHDDVQERDH
jgi:hypothetical protein